MKCELSKKIHNPLFLIHNSKGFSILEVILAAAIFILFTSGIVTVVLQGYNTNRLGAEETIATQFASEGLEAVRSIKNQNFSNLVNSSATGVIRTSNTWAFGGSNNIHEKYTRQIKVESVNKDCAGDIVTAPTGAVDPETKKITSTVNWNFNPARANSTQFVTYLSDWKNVPENNGILLYGDTGNIAQPRFRIFQDPFNTFTQECPTGSDFTDTVVGKTFKVKTSPTKQEALVGYINNSGVLRILCFDGISWTSEWTVTVGGNGTNSQRFAIAYETNTGDVLVAYSRNVATTNEMGYRTKLGSAGCGSGNWTGETVLNPVRTSGIVHWIRAEGNPTASSNNIALTWADANSDLSAMQWTGSSWGIAEPASALETNLERASASQDVQSFDIAFESITGNLMVVWSPNGTTCTAGNNCIRYSLYTSSWIASAAIPTVADRATHIDMSANPNTNELVVAGLDNSQADLSIAYWSGSAWTGLANQDQSTNAAIAGAKYVATGWLISGATTRSIVLFVNSGAQSQRIHGFVGNGSTFTRQGNETTPWFTPTPLFANPPRWLDIQMDPKNKDRLIFTLSDNVSDLFAKRLVMTAAPIFTWTNSDGGAALEATLGQATTAPFGFTYWRNP